MARAGKWERAALHGHVPENTTSQTSGTEQFSLDVEDEPASEWRPDRLAGVRPREKIQRLTVEQTIDAPLLLTLDPAPLIVEQLADVLQFVDALVPVAEKVIEVPKIILENIPVRTLVREPQLAEQLVDVPTILTPVQFHTVLDGVSKVFSQNRVHQRVEQNVHIPVPGEIFKIHQGQSSASSFHFPAGGADDASVCFVVFLLFIAVCSSVMLLCVKVYAVP